MLSLMWTVFKIKKTYDYEKNKNCCYGWASF
jgi:hypothetical protein